MDIPKNNMDNEYIFKDTAQRQLKLTFLPPLCEKYEKAPVYFLIPGGGWHMEVRADMIDFSRESVEEMRKDGFAVVATDYRVCGEGVVMQEIIEDCFDAVKYITHYAETLKVDSSKIITSGHSAGGHLALMLAYAPKDMFKSDYEFDDDFEICGCVAFSPPAVLYGPGVHSLGDINEVFVGCFTEEELERTSPITYVNANCPPTFLATGTSDYIVYSLSSEKIYDKLIEAGVQAKFVLSVGGGHMYEQINKSVIPDLSREDIQYKAVEFMKDNF
ncbi:MAG: alpha/beta hydrolase [Ruminococcaceae bacterium]|nr:alpha/beta hydrolase [Oscillospiraceae bacterium]